MRHGPQRCSGRDGCVSHFLGRSKSRKQGAGEICLGHPPSSPVLQPGAIGKAPEMLPVVLKRRFGYSGLRTEHSPKQISFLLPPCLPSSPSCSLGKRPWEHQPGDGVGGNCGGEQWMCACAWVTAAVTMKFCRAANPKEPPFPLSSTRPSSLAARMSASHDTNTRQDFAVMQMTKASDNNPR